MGFSAYFNFLLFHCAFRNQPLLLKYFLVFKLGSCHFPCKRSIQEEKSEFVHYFSRLPAPCRDFISPVCSGPAWFGLVCVFGSCLQAPWRMGRPPGGRGGGARSRFREQNQAALRPSSPLRLHTRFPPLLLERRAIQGQPPVQGPGTQGSGLRLLSLYLASSAENLKAVLAESCCSIEGANEEKVEFLFYSFSFTFCFSSFSKHSFCPSHPTSPEKQRNTHTPKKRKIQRGRSLFSKGSLRHLPTAPLGDRCWCRLNVEAGGLWPVSAFTLFQILCYWVEQSPFKILGPISWPLAFSLSICQMPAWLQEHHSTLVACIYFQMLAIDNLRAIAPVESWKKACGGGVNKIIF